MERCRIELELDQGDSRFRAGDPICGHVVVRALEVCRCDRLYAGVGLKAKAQGDLESVVNPKQGFLEGATLFSGRWEAGQAYRYPFRIPVPPVQTHVGRILDLGYFVQVAARVSGERLISEYPIEIVNRGQPLHVRWDEADLKDSKRGLRVAGVIVLGAAAVMVSLAAGLSILPLLVVGLAISAVGVAFVAMTIKPWLAERKVGRTTMEIAQEEGSAAGQGGDRSRTLRVTIRSGPDAPPGSIRAALRVREWVRKHGEGVLDWESELYREEVLLEPVRDTGEYTGRLLLPPPGLPYPVILGNPSGGSVGSAVYSIRWELTGHVDVPRWPDWERTVPLRVRPVDIPFD